MPNAFSANLETILRNRGWTSPAMAEHLTSRGYPVTFQAVDHWRSARRTPTVDALREIATILGVDPGVLAYHPISTTSEGPSISGIALQLLVYAVSEPGEWSEETIADDLDLDPKIVRRARIGMDGWFVQQGPGLTLTPAGRREAAKQGIKRPARR